MASLRSTKLQAPIVARFCLQEFSMRNKLLVDHFVQLSQRLKGKWPFLEPRTVGDKLIVEAGCADRLEQMVAPNGDGSLGCCWWSPHLESVGDFGTLTALLSRLLNGDRTIEQHKLLTRFVNLLSDNCLSFKNQQLWILLCLLVLAKEQRNVSFPLLNRSLVEVYRRRLITTKIVYSVQVVCMFTRLVDYPERLSNRLSHLFTREGAWPTDLPNRLLPYVCYALCFCSDESALSTRTLNMVEAKLAKRHRQMDLEELALVANLFALRNYRWNRALSNELSSRLASCRIAPSQFAYDLLCHACS